MVSRSFDMAIKLRWLGLACFEIVLSSGKTIITDPCIDISINAPIKSQEITGADYITISHDSYTSASDVGTLAKRFNSKVISNIMGAEPITRFFNLDPADVITATAGNIITFPDLQIEIVRGQHVSLLKSARTDYWLTYQKEAPSELTLDELRRAVPLNWSTRSGIDFANQMLAAGISHKGEQLNFIFQTDENLRIYFFDGGIFEYLKEEVKKARANIFIVQLGGNDPQEIAKLSAISGAEVIIPSHHDVRGQEMHNTLIKEMTKYYRSLSKSCLLDIVAGKWYEIGVGATAI